jgi:hypothetical protein
VALLLGAMTIEGCGSDEDAPFQGELVSWEQIDGLVWARRLRLRYVNNTDEGAQIECSFTVKGPGIKRYVTSPREVPAHDELTFETVTEIGHRDSVTDIVLSSCKAAPD